MTSTTYLAAVGGRRLIVVVTATLLASTSVAVAAGPEPAGNATHALHAQLDLSWTSPLSRDPTKPVFWQTGFFPGAWAEAPDGVVVLLGAMVGSGRYQRVLLRNAERVGPEAAAPLVLPASEPEGLQRQRSLFGWALPPNLDREVFGIAIGGDGGIWLGGYINSFMDIASARHSDAYLARLDGAGRAVWDRAYSDSSQLSISGIASTAAGSAVVAGSGYSTSWLARTGPDGARLAEWRLGSGKGIAVASLRDGRTIAAAFAHGGVEAGASYEALQAAVRAGTYRDDVLVWLLDETGVPQGPTLVREGVSRWSSYKGPGNHAGTIAMAAAGDAAYIATNWLDDTRLLGVEVDRVGPDGTVMWRQRIPQTLNCRPAIAALPNGDALVACALSGEVQVHRLDGRTGERTLAKLAPPPCQRGGYAARVSLLTRRNGTVLALGSGMGDAGDEGCSWMAQLVIGSE